MPGRKPFSNITIQYLRSRPCFSKHNLMIRNLSFLHAQGLLSAGLGLSTLVFPVTLLFWGSRGKNSHIGLLVFICCWSGEDARQQHWALVFLWSRANSQVPTESSLLSPRSHKLDDGKESWVDGHRRTWELAHEKESGALALQWLPNTHNNVAGEEEDTGTFSHHFSCFLLVQSRSRDSSQLVEGKFSFLA